MTCARLILNFNITGWRKVDSFSWVSIFFEVTTFLTLKIVIWKKWSSGTFKGSLMEVSWNILRNGSVVILSSRTRTKSFVHWEIDIIISSFSFFEADLIVFCFIRKKHRHCDSFFGEWNCFEIRWRPLPWSFSKWGGEKANEPFRAIGIAPAVNMSE